MIKAQKGFTLIELLVATSIFAIIAMGGAATTTQIIKLNGQSSNHLVTLNEVQNSGLWITRDAQMAESITTDGLTYPDFLTLSWTEWDFGNDAIYHSVTYFFDNMTGNIGNLMRNHWSSDGLNNTTLVARYIYYDLTDPDNSSLASYSSPVLSVTLTSAFDDVTEQREYTITRRPKLN